MYQASNLLLGISLIIARHPYITSVFIVTFILIGFSYSITMAVRSWSAQRQERRQREELFSRVCELGTKVEALEDNQREMLAILRELRDNAT